MIRINLLGAPKPKAKRTGPAMPVLPSEGPSPVLMFVIAIGIAIMATVYMGHGFDAESQKIQQQIKKEESDALRLAAIKQRYELRQKEAAEYENRIKVIDDLRANQSGPVNLLDTVGATVNNTDQVWLSTMNDAGSEIDVQGIALSADAVANLMTNLAKSGYFKTIEIKETYQDEGVKNMQAFNFILICLKQQAEKPGKQAGKS